LPLEYIIIFHKGATLIFLLFSMVIFQNFSLGSILYASLHGGYGVLWLIKHFAFPDFTFSQRVPLGSLIVCSLVMTIYWGFGVLIHLGIGL
jgi:hypothetical protein